MKILKYKKIKQNTYQVILDNEEKIEISEEIILKNNLLLKKEISKKELEQIIKDNSKYELYYKTLKFLSSKMRCTKEIKDKFKKEYSLKDIETVIEKLYDEKLLNNEEYIKCYINDAIKLKSIGPNKIHQELTKLEFKQDLINEYLNNIDSSIWQDKINKKISKTIQSNKRLSAIALKQKIMTDLTTKGFYKEDIIFALENVSINVDKSIYEKEYNRLKNKYSKKYQGERLEFEIKTRLRAKGFQINIE